MFPQEASGWAGLTANPELHRFSRNPVPLLSSQLQCWSWGLRSRACSQQLSSLCHSPACTLPTQIAWFLVLPSLPVRQVHQGYGQILSCQMLSPRLHDARHRLVQSPQMIRCLTPAKPVMGAAGIPAQVGAGNNLWVGLNHRPVYSPGIPGVFSLFDEPEKRGGKIPIILMASSR